MKKLLASLLILSLLLTGCAASSKPEDADIGTLSVHYIDVDQADCMLLIAGDTTVLIDGGNTGTAGNVLSYLRRFGVKELDLVVNTHPHGDHLGGIPTVLAGIPAEEVWCSHAGFTTGLFSQFKNAVEKQDLSIVCPAPGTVFREGNLSISVLGPQFGVSTYEDLNDTSLVLMVEFGQRKFLFTGDMESYAEQQLLNAHLNLKADVLKVGHHGSYSSTSQVFLDAVDPEYGVISCGRDNEYGHPHNGPMHRLEHAEVELYRTDLMGSVVVVTDGNSLAFFLETRDTELTGYGAAA